MSARLRGLHRELRGVEPENLGNKENRNLMFVYLLNG